MENSKNTILNIGQTYAVLKIKSFLRGEIDKKFITISGPGGSGKTFLLKEALKSFSDIRIRGATISHFAKKILQDSLGKDYIVTTLAAMLNMSAGNDDKGELLMSYVDIQKVKESLKTVDVIIIDEASMVDDELFHFLMQLDKKIIAVGDKYQLPPVGQDHDSIFFDNIDAELTEVMRFTGPIHKLSMVYVNEIAKYNAEEKISKHALTLGTKRISTINDVGSGYVFLNDIGITLKMAAQEFKKNKNALTGVRIIAYKNSTINLVNKFIRKMLYGKKAKMFEVGELLINTKGYRVSSIKNGDIFKVISVRSFMDSSHYEIYQLTLEDDYGNTKMASVLADTPSNMYQFDEALSRLSNISKLTNNWKEYMSLRDRYATFKYYYAVSVHKIQGSTVDNVYVFEDEIMSVKPTTYKEKFQSLYVAVTRASHRCYIYNPSAKTDNTRINVNIKRYK